MKKWYLILGILLAGYEFSIGQDNYEEAYFHELKGMEDSTGTTHLFYRQFSSRTQECTYEDHNGEIITYDLTITQNDVRHYNTYASSDSVKFRHGQSVWSDCYVRYTQNLAYTFLDNNPEKSIVKELYDTDLIAPSIRNWKGDVLNPDFASPNTIVIDSLKQVVLIPTPLEYIVAKSTGSSNPEYLRSTMAAQPDGSNWDQINLYDKTPDSLFYDFTILGINPISNSEYFVVREDSLFHSDDHGETLSFITENPLFETAEADLFFNKEEKIYYFSFKTGHRLTSLTKQVWKLSYTEEGWNWEPAELPEAADIHAFDLDYSAPNEIFISDNTTIYTSHNHAESFTEFKTLDNTITGLYKKPGSDILYILTKKELLEVNTLTGESTSLKQLPVSNEQEPHHSDLPRSIELQQNYPNPFNPVTVIGYQLPENQEVTLEVFDVTGRRVAVLVNEHQSAGTHQVTFDASRLSSGVYLYRITTREGIRTRKMILVK